MPTTAAELIVKVSADTAQAEGDLRSFSSRMLSGAGGMGAVFGGTLLTAGVLGAGRALGGLAKGVVGLGADAIGAGADFAYSMDQVAAVLGATEAEMAQLSATAVGLGMNPNLKVSTEEAAAAMYSLATAGLTTTDIVGGAAEATILLANATGGDMAQAGQVATDAMALWGMSADQLGESINGVVGVSNASKFDLNDYALALAQGGGVAAMAGMSFEDFNATIAATSSYFSSGSDAGTSLKTFLAQLTPTTKKAKEAMTDLGLITAEGHNKFYGMNGELMSMENIAGTLTYALEDLTEMERKQALQTIFGNDAMRTAGALAQMTADDFYEVYKTVNDGTSAMDQARIRTDNLKSAWQTFGDTIDAAKTKFGLTMEVPLQMAIKALTPLVDTMSTFIQPYIDEATAWLTTNIPVIEARIPFALEAWNSAPGFLSGITAAIGELSGKSGELAPVVSDLSAMDAALKAFGTTGANPFPAFFAGIAAALTGGTAEFDAATGVFTAKWAAFQVEMSKTGKITMNVEWEAIFTNMSQGGPVAAGREARKWLEDAFKTKPIVLTPAVLVDPKVTVVKQEGGNWFAKLMDTLFPRVTVVEPGVKVKPLPTLDMTQWGPVRFVSWLGEQLGLGGDSEGTTTEVDAPVAVMPEFNLAFGAQPLFEWLKASLGIGGEKTSFDVVQPVTVTPDYSPSDTGFSLIEWLKKELFSPDPIEITQPVIITPEPTDAPTFGERLKEFFAPGPSTYREPVEVEQFIRVKPILDPTSPSTVADLQDLFAGRFTGAAASFPLEITPTLSPDFNVQEIQSSITGGKTVTLPVMGDVTGVEFNKAKYSTDYDVGAIVETDPVWGSYTTTYGTGAKVDKRPDFGNWSWDYKVTATVTHVNNVPSGNSGGAVDAQATGTLSARGGLTWVGERGPELVALPGASRVWNNSESMAMAGAGGPQVVMYNTVADAIDIEVLARRVGQYLRMG